MASGWCTGHRHGLRVGDEGGKDLLQLLQFFPTLAPALTLEGVGVEPWKEQLPDEVSVAGFPLRKYADQVTEELELLLDDGAEWQAPGARRLGWM